MDKNKKLTLLILDIDNTINNKNINGEIHLIQEFKNLYKKLKNRNDIKVTYNTTRGISQVFRILKDRGEYFGSGIISALNGGLIYDLKNMKQIHSYVISKEAKIFLSEQFIKDENITFMAMYSNNDIYGRVFLKDQKFIDEFYKAHDFSFNFDKNRCISDKIIYSTWIKEYEINMIEFHTLNKKNTTKNFLNNNDINFSFDGHYYINAKGVDKGKGIEELKNIFLENKSRTKIIVVGDSLTDKAMFDDSNFMNIAIGNKINFIESTNYKHLKNPVELCDFLYKLFLKNEKY